MRTRRPPERAPLPLQLIRLCVVGVLLFGVRSGMLSAQASPRPRASDVVRQLYHDFACEAASAVGCGRGQDFADQPRSVLVRYFDASLVSLWLNDRECTRSSHEICRIDFSPLWASQDPEGTRVSFPTRDQAGKDTSVVAVQVRPDGSTTATELHYSLVRTPAGWRIHDIAEPSRWSLRALLSQKM